MRKTVLFLSLLFTAWTATVALADAKTDRAYGAIVSEVVLPGFRDLASAGERHRSAWLQFCEDRTEPRFSDLVRSFHDLADAWARVEMFRSGTGSEDFLHERFYFWPDRKNAVERGLALLLKQAARGRPSAAQVGEASAAAQGLPALERLVFADGKANPDRLRQGVGDDRCNAGVAISANASALAVSMEGRWRAVAGQASEGARASLATDLVTFHALLKDTKVEAVIGKSNGSVKPRSAEFWRSGRTMRNIVLNLETLERVSESLSDGNDESVLSYATRSAHEIASSITVDLATLASGGKRRNAILLRDALDSAQDRAIIEVPAALGVTVGFNSLDGD